MKLRFLTERAEFILDDPRPLEIGLNGRGPFLRCDSFDVTIGGQTVHDPYGGDFALDEAVAIEPVSGQLDFDLDGLAEAA